MPLLFLMLAFYKEENGGTQRIKSQDYRAMAQAQALAALGSGSLGLGLLRLTLP